MAAAQSHRGNRALNLHQAMLKRVRGSSFTRLYNIDHQYFLQDNFKYMLLFLIESFKVDDVEQQTSKNVLRETNQFILRSVTR